MMRLVSLVKTHRYLSLQNFIRPYMTLLAWMSPKHSVLQLPTPADRSTTGFEASRTCCERLCRVVLLCNPFRVRSRIRLAKQ